MDNTFKIGEKVKFLKSHIIGGETVFLKDEIGVVIGKTKRHYQVLTQRKSDVIHFGHTEYEDDKNNFKFWIEKIPIKRKIG